MPAVAKTIPVTWIQTALSDADRFDDVGLLQDRRAQRHHQRDDEAHPGNPFQRADPAADATKAGGSGTPVL